MYYQNVRSVKNKLKSVTCNFPLFSYDIIILTETRLNNQVYDAELGFHDHVIYRCDRDSTTSTKQRAGGVLIALNKSLNSELISIENNTIETLFVLVKFKTLKIVLNATYLPPCTSPELFQNYVDLVDLVFLKFPDATKFVFGDFNLPQLQWKPCENTHYLQSYNSNSTSDILLGSMAFNGLVQINNQFNSLGRLLDLVFVNDYMSTIRPLDDDDALVQIEGYHPPLAISTTLSVNKITPNYDKREVHCYSKCNFIEMRNYFRDIKWDSIFDNQNSLDTQIAGFYNIIQKGISSFVPKISIGNFRFPIWYSQELREKITEKKILHKNFKRFPSNVKYIKFSQARRTCKALSKSEYEKYIADSEKELQENPRKLFTFLRNKKHSNIQPPCLTLNDTSSDNSKESANLFAERFASVYSDEVIVPPEPNLERTLISSISNIELEEQKVFNKLKKLKRSSSSGPDGVPPILLLECATELTAPLTFLFHRSLISGYFPSNWKTSYVIPLHKSGLKTDVKNYRPIAKLSAIPKLFESLVCDEIQPVLSSVIVNNQHGFVRNKSTLTSLLCLYQSLTTTLENKCQADCIYTDFSKAYDKVNINILCNKLKAIGVEDPLLSWTRTYLTNRTQIVQYNNTFSHPIKVNSGCIQGGHISGILFNIFINDLIPNINQVLSLLFADDLRLSFNINGREDQLTLQRALDSLHTWCEVNRMDLNVDKCFVLSFHRKKNPLTYEYNIGGVVLERIHHVKDLGVTLDSDLKFTTHYNEIKNKALRNLGFIQRNSRDFKSPKTIKNLYCSLARPTLEYCSPLWSPSYTTYIDMLEKIQRKFLRFLAVRERIKIENHDYSEILSVSKLSTLEHRRNIADVIFLHKLLHNKVNCPELLSYVNVKAQRISSRHHLLFEPTLFKTNIGQNCPLNRLMKLSNIVTSPPLDFDFFTTSSDILKSKLFVLSNLNQ